MAVRNMERENQQKRRITVAFVDVLGCYLALMARLVYLQGIQGAQIRSIAQHRREGKKTLLARRGRIFAANNVLLATSLYAGDVGFDPMATFSTDQNPRTRRKLEQTIEKNLQTGIPRLANILHIPVAELTATVANARKSCTGPKPNRFVPIKRAIPLDAATAVKAAHVIGFSIQDGSTRVYASGANAAQVVGKIDSQGQFGLEKGCNPWLQGKNGQSIAEMDDRGREIPETQRGVIPEQNGFDVHTTLDSNAQHIATQEAEKIAQQYHPKGVSIVVLDPNTGDIKAMVSLPNFDPNPEHRKDLHGLPIKDLEEHFRDRCAASLYEPGSTLKALTIASAIDNKSVNLDDTFYCSGEIMVAKKTIHCAHGEVHGEQGLGDILRHSCNIGAAEIGMRMKAKRLKTAMEQFGLFDQLSLQLPRAAHGFWSLDHNENQYNEAKAARVAFGHSISTTPLHVALAYAALANGGTLMKPRLVTSVTDGNRVVKKFDPVAVRRVISPHTSALVSGMLRSVVSNGTAKAIATRGYEFAGKTGTAKKYQPDKYVGSFVGFLPANPKVRPQLVILVAVDEPQGDKYYGGEVAAPAFQSIATQLAQYWHIPEDDPDGSQYKEAQYNISHPEKLHLHGN